MIGLDPIVLPGGVHMASFGEQLVEELWVDRGLVCGDLARPAAMRQHPDEEQAGGGLARRALARISTACPCVSASRKLTSSGSLADSADTKAPSLS